MRGLAKVASYLLYFAILLMWAFTDEINNMETNELIVLVTIVLVGVLDKDE